MTEPADMTDAATRHDDASLDELKHAWRALERRLEGHLTDHLKEHTALQRRQWVETRTDRVKRRLHLFVVGQIALMVAAAWGAWMVGLGPDAPEPSLTLRLSALLCMAYFFCAIGTGAWVLQRVGEIDFGAPVVEIQARLLALRRTYLVASAWIGLPWWFVWLPFAVCAMFAIAGVDLGAMLDARDWFANLAFAAAGIGGCVWVYRRSQREPDSPRARRWRDGLNALSLNAAERELQALREFVDGR